MKQLPRCGNVNPLTKDDVITLPAGGRVALGWLGGPTFETAGVQAVSLELENVPHMPWSDMSLGRHDASAMKKAKGSPPFKAVSNVVSVRVEP